MVAAGAAPKRTSGKPTVSVMVINISQYPNLQPVPGYPVYYAPRLRANDFFDDGLYWV